MVSLLKYSPRRRTKPFSQNAVLSGILFLIFLIPIRESVAQSDDSLRVLFLGASYFSSAGGSYQPFEGFCNAANIHCEAVSQRASPPFEHGVTFLGLETQIRNGQDAASSIEVHKTIRDGNFDFVIVWAYLAGIPDEWLPDDYDERFQSPSYEETLASLTSLHRTIVSSGAETVLYMWHPWLPLMHLMHPVAQNYNRLQADLSSIEVQGQKHNVLMIPIGLLWLDAVTIPDKYSYEDRFGNPPPRFHKEDWYRDPGHPAALGQFANGCLVFTYLTGNDPRQSDFNELPRNWNEPPEAPAQYVPKEQADWIKERVWLYYRMSRYYKAYL